MNLLEQFMQELLGLLKLISKDGDISPIEKARILNAALKLGRDYDAVKTFTISLIGDKDSSYNEVLLQLGDVLLKELTIKVE